MISLIQGTAAQAAVEPDILKPEQAFRYTTSATANEVVIRWRIEPAHYLYRERMSYESRTPAITLGSAVIPEGTPHNDEYFGQMHIFRDQLEVRLPVSDRPPGPVSLALAIKSQGCADIGLCYPPQVWLTNVELPAAGTATPGKLGALLDRPRRRASDEPLPVAQAFPLDTTLSDDFTLQIRWDITPGYYLYRHTLKASTSGDSVQLGPPALPAGTPMSDETYGDTLVFHEPVTMTVPLIRRGPAAVSLPLTIEYQGCKLDSICYPPQRVQLTLELPAISTDRSRAAMPAPQTEAEQDRLYTVIRDGNLLAVMAMFAGFGLLLSFTPCCLPMYPILSGIIVGQSGASAEGDSAQKRGTARSFLLSVAFVLGMAVTYTALGAIFAAAGAQVQAVMQKPAVTIGVALLFVALALSMFGLFDLQIPSSWQTRLNAMSGRQRSGQLLGAGVMGMISAAVVTTCVTPPLVAALTVIARTGDLTRGALALFALAIGMGIPLLAIGASAGHLMPKTGAWMNSVKAIFGLMMLGMAVWMLDRLWSGTVTMALWGILLVTASILLGTFTSLEGNAGMAPKLGKALGLVALLYGLVLLLGAFGGSKDASQPLEFLRGTSPDSADRDAESSPLTRIKTSVDLDTQLARAITAGRPVMLDFYADWCVSCKELEKYTFSDPAVRKALENAIALQADVTAMDAEDQALMERFGIIGPPTIVFFNAGGDEQAALRVVGFMKAEAFAAHLRSAFATPSDN